MSNTTADQTTLTIDGGPLTISQVSKIATRTDSVQLEAGTEVAARMDASASAVERAVSENRVIYGVTTGFGGMSDVPVPAEEAAASQDNLLSFLATGAGAEIDRRHVRAAMLLRANVLARGCSGVRFEIVKRLLKFLEADATPVVRELGSIGASGDLVPLSVIARSVTGITGFARVRTPRGLESVEQVLASLGYESLQLRPKEGLAIVNGTSFSSAVAANCRHEAGALLALTLATQAMMARSLLVRMEPFAEFVHRHKPHPGQVWIAETLRELLRHDDAGNNGSVGARPGHVQDRYSLRCLPQYMGPIAETLDRIGRTVEIEMNAVSDNPLVDAENNRFYQSGNFLGQYIGLAMDDLRRCLGLMAKHLDVQIAALSAPEFNNGLPGSLRGNSDRSYNMGLKGLQITGNSIMPLLTWHATPLVEHFPTHAEQFNQDVNGLSWGSANLAWKAIELYQHYLSVALVFAVQSLDLRAHASLGHYDGRTLLGAAAVPLYEAACGALGTTPGRSKPFLNNDSDRWLEQDVESLRENISSHGSVISAVESIVTSFTDSCR